MKIKQILVIPTKEIENTKPIKKSILISFSKPGENIPIVDGWKKVLNIQCNDISPEEVLAEQVAEEPIMDINNRLIFFETTHAERIIVASLKRGVENIVINCDGSGKSLAIVRFFSEKYDCKVEDKSNKRRPMNKHIYDTMKDVNKYIC